MKTRLLKLVVLGIPLLSLALGVVLGSLGTNWRGRSTSHSAQGIWPTNRFALCPTQGSFGIELHLVDFPGESLLLRCPEAIGCNLADVGCFRDITGTRWRFKENRWILTEEFPNLSYSTFVSTAGPWVDIEFLLENRSAGTSGSMGVTNCLSGERCPLLADREMERTFLRHDGKWVALKDCVGTNDKGELTCQNWYDYAVSPGTPPRDYWAVAKTGADEPLIVVESADGKWTLIFAFLPSDGLMNNREFPCVHAQTRLPDTPDGGTARAVGRIGLIQGDKDAARKALNGWLTAQRAAE